MTKSSLERLTDRATNDEEILAVILFGSYARGEFTDRSDVDVCLVLERGRYERLRLSEIKVDYSAAGDLDVQVFQQLPLYVRRRVLREGKVLHVKNEDQLYELAFRTAQEFEDFRPGYELYLRTVSIDRS